MEILLERQRKKFSLIRPLFTKRKQQIEITRRGEGDVDRKSSKDQSNGSSGGAGANAKVERRESARLSCGASKFLRSLRSGAQSIKENREQVNVIALKELDSENIDLEVKGQEKNPVFRLPERSQSFQEKRLLVVTSKSSESPTSNGNVKIKHSRAQSFVCNTQAAAAHHNNSVTSNTPSSKLSVNLTEKLSSPTTTTTQPTYGNLIKDKRHALISNSKVQSSSSSSSTPCETIYENVEVIREQQNYGDRMKNRRNSSNSSLCGNNNNNLTPSCQIITSPNGTMKDVQKRNSLPPNTTTTSSSGGKIHENGSNTVGHRETTDRRSSKKSTKDSGYEMNHSDYMNCDLIKGSAESISSKEYYSGGSLKMPSNSTSNPSNPSRKDNTTTERNSSSSRKSSLDYAAIRSTSRECLDDRMQQQHHMMEGRKLRRSISEVPSSKTTMSSSSGKPKNTDHSRVIYSTFTNGLSVWNVENKLEQQSSPVTGIYHQVGSTKSLVTAVSTLPRRPPTGKVISSSGGEYHISAKSTPSLKNALDIPWESRNGTNNNNNKIYCNISPISSAHSTPNLKISQKQQLAKNHIYETPKSVKEQIGKGTYSSANSGSSSSFIGSEKHPGALLPKNLEKSNENIYRISFPPSSNTNSSPTSSSSQTVEKQSNHHQNSPSNMSNNVGNNNGTSWANNDPLLACSSTSTSSLSGAPVRDSSTLKQIRYGPGHEKYPSWPIPVSSAAQIDPAGELSNGTSSNSGSSRSKSWTEQTDYPKEKGPSYARPYMKRMNQAYTQQLKTVMEKCERIPPETYAKSSSGGVVNGSGGQRQHNGYSSIVPPPLGYRDIYNGNSYHRLPKNENDPHGLRNLGHNSVDKEYNIPSPPERDVSDQSNKSFPAEDLELYAKKYEEMMNQYAQSEGYHSYISSECSSYISSGTPFLDQLRRESESNQQFWSGDPCDPNDPLFGIGALVTSGRESVTTVVTNSSSNSSGTETLKWHGSTSDLSMTSGPGSINSSSRVWENQQNIAHSAKVPMPQKLHPESLQSHNGLRHNKNKLESQNPTKKSYSNSASSEEQTVASTTTTNLKKFPLSTYIRPTTLPISPESQQHHQQQQQHQQQAEPEKKMTSSSSSSSVASATNHHHHQHQQNADSSQTSPIIDTSKPPSVAERILELEQQSCHSSPVNSNNKHAVQTSLPSNDKFPKSSSLNCLRDKAQPQHPKPHTSKSPVQVKKDAGGGETHNSKGMSNSSSDGYPSLWTDFNEPPHSLRTPESPNSNTNSANFPVSYTYLDPEKKHKVADMTLKAIQKKALLSYYERHTGKSSTTGTNSTATNASTDTNNLRNSNNNSQATSPSAKNDSQANTLLDKDPPYPSNRLTLSLPRDIDRLREPARNESYNNNNSNNNQHHNNYHQSHNHHHHRSPDESSRSSSHSSSISSMTFPAAVVGSKMSPTSPTDSSDLINVVDKGDTERSSHSARSLEDLTSSESARMAYMSKYLPHLVNNRDSTGSTPSWGGMNNVQQPLGVNSSVPSKEPAPVPPERPPKKPHLRNMSQQSSDQGTKSPPPPLPRAPVRQPAPPPCQPESLPPPVPSKPALSIPRCMSPDLPPPPPPPPVAEEEVEVINDDPLPPPPTMTEVQNLVGSRSRSVSGLSSYLHKDSYLAQRKERTLGYEGRYRRTLSPSGLGSKSAAEVAVTSPQRPIANATSTEKLESTLSPSAWEKYHNIRAPSTTVIFTSNEIAKPTASSQPVFHRSISWDSNLFNNKTGFSQATVQPPVAQVAPLRGASDVNRSNSQPSSSLEEQLELLAATTANHHQNNSNMGSEKNSPSLMINGKESPMPGVEMEGCNGHMDNNNSIKTSVSIVVKKSTAEAQCQIGDMKTNSFETTSSPVPYENGLDNKENIPVNTISSNNIGCKSNSNNASANNMKTSEISLRINCTSDAYSQTDSSSASSCSSGHEDSEKTDIKVSPEPSPVRPLMLTPATTPEMLNTEGEVENANKKTTTTATNSASSNNHMGLLQPSTVPSYTGRQKSNEELECDELSRDLAKQLPQGDKLQSLLVPLPEHKTPADYIEGLFPLELKMRVEPMDTKGHNGVNSNFSNSSSPVPEEYNEAGKGGQRVSSSCSGSSSSSPTPAQNGSRKESEEETVRKRCNGHAPLPADSAYFTTSESKAKFLTQYVKDMHNESISGTDTSEELIKQKEELVSRISRKLEILRTEQLEIREEIQSNEHLGQLVIERVKQTAKRNEFDKFKLHVEEIEKITSLLLGLSGRLARAENALMGLAENPNPQEKKILESKRDKLKEQLDEAKILKENIDRRSAQVSGFLQKYLSVEEYADYHHFVKMKAKLIIDSREIDDKIKLGEEQMLALQETLSSSSSSSASSCSSSS